MDALFDGQSARDKQGLQLTERPIIPIANKKTELIHVPGANRSLTIEEGYESVPFPVSFNFMNKDGAKAQLREAIAWLSSKETIAFDDDPNFYRVIQQTNFDGAENSLKQHAKFTVELLTEPHWYTDAGTSTITDSGTITNPSSEPVRPVITLNGNGTIVLTVNGEDTVMTNVTGSVTLDGINLIAHKDGADRNNEMTGDFPELKPGSNTITVTNGTADIEKRWAYR